MHPHIYPPRGPTEPDGSRLIIIIETIPSRAARRILTYVNLVKVGQPDFVKNELRQTLDQMIELLKSEE